MQRSILSLFSFTIFCLLFFALAHGQEHGLYPETGFAGFLKSVKAGQHDEVRMHLSASPDLIVARDKEYGATALHWAAAAGDLKMCTLLLELGADPCDRNKVGKISAEVARLSNHSELAVPLRCGETSLEALLFEAVKDGDLPTLVQVLDLKPTIVNTVDDLGATPLHWAAHKGFAAIVVYLLDFGANATARNNKGNRPADQAKGQQSVWGMVNNSAASSRNTALLSLYSPRLGLAVGQQQIADQIQKQGFSRDINGNYDEVIKALENPQWQRPPELAVFMAAHESDIAMLRRLLRACPDLIRAIDPADGGTLLHAAAADGSQEAVSFLLLRGVDPSTTNAAGDTPYKIALKAGRQDVAEMIKGSCLR